MREKNENADRSVSSIFLLTLVGILIFIIPFEHKYDKLLRHLTLYIFPNVQFRVFFYLSDLICLGVFIYGLFPLKNRIFGFTKTDFSTTSDIKKMRLQSINQGNLLLISLIGVVFLSLCLSPLRESPTLYVIFLQFITPLLLYIFISGTSIDSKKLLSLWVWIIFSTGLIQAIFGIIQYFTQHQLGLRFFGEQPLFASIFVPHGHRWLADIFTGHISNELVYRAMGTMPHSNILGGFLAVSLIASSYLFVKNIQWRWQIGIAYFIQLFGLFVSFSRSGIFAYVIATSIFLFWLHYRQKIAIRSLALLSLFSILLAGLLLYEPISYRGGIFNSTSLSRASNETRLHYQDLAIQMIQEHPLTGVGFNQFSATVQKNLTSVSGLAPATTVHNIYLLIASESGLIALILFLLWIGYVLKIGWTVSISLEMGMLISSLIGLLFIGGCDFYPILNQQGKLLLFGIAALIAKHAQIPKNNCVKFDV